MAEQKTFEDLGIDTLGKSGAVKTLCPLCSHTRKPANVREKCLSVDTLTGLYHCHNCGESGIARTDSAFSPSLRERKIYKKPSFLGGDAAKPELLEWFAGRGIESWVLRDLQISAAPHYMPSLERETFCMCFPYYLGGELINVKYRGLSVKTFSQEKDAKKIFYNLDKIGEHTETIICEGEIDVCSFAQAGVNAISVPDGASPEGAVGTDLKFEYVGNSEAVLTPIKKIIIATDNDGPGRTLANELARRLGEDRCWRFDWPSSCKDANDVLVDYGPETLVGLLEQARPWPIHGIIEPIDVIDDVLALRRNQRKLGVSTGWKTLDPYYKVLTPEVTLIGGTPSHGKSNFINNLSMNLARLHDWGVALACFEEGRPPDHYARLTSKFTEKSYWPIVNDEQQQTDSEIIDAVQFMQGKFFLLRLEFEERTIAKIIDTATQAVRRHGIRCLFLDPWNHVNHKRDPGMNETEYISHVMSQLRDFAELYDAHVFLCAHPAKPIMAKVEGSMAQRVPHPYETSGSAHFFNKTDNFLTIFRDVEDSTEEKRVSVYVQKIRTQRVGKIGHVELRFDRVSECLYDLGTMDR